MAWKIALSLLAMVLLGACEFQNARLSSGGGMLAVGNTEARPGDVPVVGSVSSTQVARGGLGATGVVYGFWEYDGATQRLKPQGTQFILTRSTCTFGSGGECELINPDYQVVSVPPGDYALVYIEWRKGNTYPIKHYLVAYDKDWWSTDLVPDASIAEAPVARVHVMAEGITNFGDIVVQSTSKYQGSNTFSYDATYALRRHDELAAAALRDAGLQDLSGVVYSEPRF